MTPSTVSRPWVRYFARGIDFTLYTFILTLLLLTVLRVPPPGGVLFTLVMSYLAWLLMLCGESVLLSTWGYTPGKWLFGLKVRDEAGEKLTYTAAWERTVGVFSKGEGYNVPFYDLYRLYRSYQCCADGVALPWEYGCSYTVRDGRVPLGAVAWVTVHAGCIGVSVLLLIGLYLPKAKGPLTAQAFAQSYNETARRYEMGAGYDLNADGTWTQGDGNVFYIGGAPRDLVLEETGGYLTQVKTASTEVDPFAPGGVDMATLLTLLGAQSGVNVFNWQSEVKALESLLGGSYENYTIAHRGLTITNDVSYTGYELIMDGEYLLPQDGQPQSFHQEFTVSIAW